jgi:hypothetical protein
MATGTATLGRFAVKGDGSCIGGKHPDPPLDKFPKLAWAVWHPKHGNKVFTEDQAVTVEDIAIAACEVHDLDVLAARFKTTPEHARQAIEYALAAQYLAE